jgi:hypothetical protein
MEVGTGVESTGTAGSGARTGARVVYVFEYDDEFGNDGEEKLFDDS